ncbi:MAG: LPXTG cell wall anchor domain-containing protein [Mogibacterium sp.]|nr:LPXTG cell wall anchor domain-containing protein [Mogibacterium sp.]
MKKILTILLAAVMVLAMSVSVFAGGPTKGSIKVMNATKGYEYKAYKVFDATYNGDAVSYKTAADNASKLDSDIFEWSAADKDGNISVWVKDNVPEATVITWVKENYTRFGGTAISGTWDDTDSTVTFKNLDFGYYYITSSLGAAVTIDSAIPNETVYDKNEAEGTDPVKTIVSVDGTDVNDLEEADAHVGSKIGFKIEANTTNWINENTIRREFEITDTPTYMTIDEASVKVKVNGNEVSAYTAAVSGGTLTVKIPMVDDHNNSVYPANEGDEPGQIPVEITYEATIEAEAADKPAKNQIPGDSVKIYTYAFHVAKTDGTDPLKGAQFELWSKKSGDTSQKLTFIDNEDGTYTYSADGTVTTLDMTENTTISVKGLDKAWDYTLKETKVPEGYNPAKDVEIKGTTLTKVGDGISTSKDSSDLATTEVVNKAGAELPSTGGIGTVIFYALGAALVIGGAIALIVKRRMSSSK